jgi:TM2 domain-containing membrane protein YozV
MAIHIHCPSCHKPLAEMRQDCSHCGVELPIGVRHALAVALGETPMPPPMLAPRRTPAHLTRPGPSPPVAPPAGSPTPHSRLRPWLAAVLSLLCGLGQLYNGQIVKGLVLMALGAAAVVSLPLLLGKLLIPVVWLYAIVDAFLVARRRRVPVSPRLVATPYNH